ncbi:restriction endonuclease subunit S [Mycoplasma sp. 1654_15]|uniref:restriction endonuclease subunit S n=1 Tax=Mycoplasma sp. 1654_15 TaxID=2725994 RepID=UPI0014495AEC|nr:restriction endonuclease subunit S [Mycoplasma sp. 1654_15]QJB71321.1 hypothetical protein HF996_02415 [Mycoplasma sp. 1654_15]
MKNNFEWKEYKIGELCWDTKNKYTKNKEYAILLNTKDISKEKIQNHAPSLWKSANPHFKYILEVGTIIYSKVAPIYKHFMYVKSVPKSKYSYVIADSFLILSTNEKIVKSKFLYNILRNENIIEHIHSEAITRSTTLPWFNFSELSLLKVSIPPFEIQDKIIKITDSLDNKIETNEKIIENLKFQILTLYRRYFVDVDIEQNIKTQGWKKQSLLHNDLCSVINARINKFEGDKEYFATADVQHINIKNGRLVSSLTIPGRSSKQPILYSVWFSTLKDSSKHILLNNALKYLVENSLFSTDFAGLKCTQTTFEYIASYILFPLFEQIKSNLSHGSAQQRVIQDDFNNIPLIVPPKSIIENYHNLTKAMFENLNTLLLENKKLEKLRDKLITKLLNNELDLSKIKV